MCWDVLCAVCVVCCALCAVCVRVCARARVCVSRLSKHHVSGEPLPTALMETMIAAKCVHESVFMMRQIYLATLDLSIHGAYNGGGPCPIPLHSAAHFLMRY